MDKDLRFSKSITRHYRQKGCKNPYPLAMVYSYVRYWCKASDDGVCRVRVQRIANWFELSRHTVYRSLNTLAEDGLIRKSTDGKGWVVTGEIPDIESAAVLTRQGVVSVL